eukprot:TRINITY_DN7852_c0_g1_i1.p1 TRINITY_DN7852_c0_g1~~TRINITY_DN7852_c0_g1_i1.p1  ORF type:complete len:163 (+),score=8.50 TRINITY_DN7852_c0_g1_i1:60-491(+)
MAEIVFLHCIKERGVEKQWRVDSCGTANYHVGDSPDERTVYTVKKVLGSKCPPVTHRGRQVTKKDFTTFDYMFCMDNSNLRNLKQVQPSDSTTKLALLGSWDPKGRLEVDDPYYGGDEGFLDNYEHITRCCNAFLDSIYKEDK